MARQNVKAEFIHLRSVGADLGERFLPACARTPGDARIAGLPDGREQAPGPLRHPSRGPGGSLPNIIAETGGGPLLHSRALGLVGQAPGCGRDQAERRRRRR